MALKFSNLVRTVIMEQGRYELLKDRYTKAKKKDDKVIAPKMSTQKFDELVLADPTTRRDGDKIKKAGAYVPWLLKQFLNLSTQADEVAQFGTPEHKSTFTQLQDLFFEDLYKTTEDLQKFDRFKNKLEQEYRDINKLSIKKLNDLMLPYSLEKTKASKDEKEEAKQTYEHPGADVVLRGSNWTIVKITDQGKLGKDAACFYGGNDKKPGMGESGWCTSSPGLSYFDRYIKDGPLYVILPNSPEEFMSGGPKVGDISGLPAKRYQFHFPSNQYMDANDRQIDLVKFLNENPELREYFKPEFAKGFQKGGHNSKQVVIDYPRDSSSKYLALYGFDDLFEQLPKDLKRFDFVQSSGGYYGSRDTTPINLKLPERIGEYKDLEALNLDGVVSELPESLGNLKKLMFLSLPNNKDLKSLPKSIADIPNLAIINLKGSNPNIEIPEEVSKKAEESDLIMVK